MIKDELLDPKVNLSPIEIDIEPDWTGVWTAEKAEAELQGFKFKGPGWYHYRTSDSILVLPFEAESSRFRFHVWNKRDGRLDGRLAFKAALSLPTHTLE